MCSNVGGRASLDEVDVAAVDEQHPGTESARRWATSRCLARKFIGTATAPTAAMANSASTAATLLVANNPTRSPGATPCDCRTAAPRPTAAQEIAERHPGATAQRRRVRRDERRDVDEHGEVHVWKNVTRSCNVDEVERTGTPAGGSPMNQVGKRFKCETCGSEVLVTKAGDGELHCCGTTMELVKPKQTASAD